MMQQRLGNGLGDPNGLSLPITTLPYIKQSEFVISDEDKMILRECAKRVAELAARPQEQQKKKLWLQHNSLDKNVRPLVLCDAENGWYEIVPHDQLKCRGDLARIWEFRLRKEIFWGESICDDKVIEASFEVQYVYDENYFIKDFETTDPHDLDGAYTWEPAIPDYQDLSKLQYRETKIDFKRTEELVNLVKETVGDILQIKMDGCFWWSLGMCTDLILLRGMENMMADMYEYPDELHQVMAFLRDDNLKRLDFLEESGVLTLNNGGKYVGSGGFGWTDELPAEGSDGSHVRTRDMWGFCESQETLMISPQMFAEFIYQYQLPILERFGLNCYGCCEPVDKRWDIIAQTPNLRRVSVSAWANIYDMAEKLKDQYIYSWKPRPADLAVPNIDEDSIRSYIRETVQAARGCTLEIIMKDNHTICGNPQNVVDWTRIAMEEAGA